MPSIVIRKQIETFSYIARQLLTAKFDFTMLLDSFFTKQDNLRAKMNTLMFLKKELSRINKSMKNQCRHLCNFVD